APIALGMANHPGLEDFDLSSLRYVMWGATPVAEEVAHTVTRRVGVRWLPAYGTSEVPVIAANPVQEPDRWRLDTVGLAVPGVQVRIVDPERGEVLAAGETGEIEVLSASAMAGYLPQTATAAAFRDGWYRTGDIGWLEPEGWLHITDRLKEMVKVRGFQVAPAEIEAVLHGDVRVRDCAVFGVPDPDLGEAIVAAVVVVDGESVTADELQETVATQLAGYKRVRHVVFVDEIPRLPSGKALRRTLKQQWLAR
ncbi:MAG TPA: AMP-binding protein, partial [Acidimicrobiia bacterium]|nr:AMP-binding protein [Acidimicrobiia bacterium]